MGETGAKRSATSPPGGLNVSFGAYGPEVILGCEGAARALRGRCEGAARALRGRCEGAARALLGGILLTGRRVGKGLHCAPSICLKWGPGRLARWDTVQLNKSQLGVP